MKNKIFNWPKFIKWLKSQTDLPEGETINGAI